MFVRGASRLWGGFRVDVRNTGGAAGARNSKWAASGVNLQEQGDRCFKQVAGVLVGCVAAGDFSFRRMYGEARWVAGRGARQEAGHYERAVRLRTGGRRQDSRSSQGRPSKRRAVPVMFWRGL